ncbi:MAG TPA: hypothetical protein VFU62_13780 [Hanamia sp.]|jgi:hypothetical protein|nr:hypothetical protein [Hanamia sp.]
MDLGYLNVLPEWNDMRFHDSEGDEWKNVSGQRLAAKMLYEKWREVFGLVMAFADNLATDSDSEETETHEQTTKRFIFENAMIIGPKLMSAAGTDLYILQMENASIIRANARQMMEQVGFAVLMGFSEESYKEVITEAINQFRELFKNWVATFEKDGIEDEWGLFI